MFAIVRTNNEIDDVLNACAEAEDSGRSKFPGMTYEQGVKYAIEWLIDYDAEHPFED